VPRHAPRGGTGRLTGTHHLRVDLLWHRFELTVDDELLPAIEPLLHRAVQPVTPEVVVRLEARREGDRFVVDENGDRLVEATEPRDVAIAVFERAHRRMFELASRKGWLRIHGAVLEVGGRRLAVIGWSGAGKTTLALAALAAGLPAESDESFLSDGHRVLAAPRRFHCEAGTFELVPAAREWAERSPLLHHVEPTWAIDPGEVTGRWELRCAPLDAIVVLTGHPEPRVRPIGVPDALPALLAEALPATESRAAVMARLAPLLAAQPLVALDGDHSIGPDDRLRLLAESRLR
jgi:hypothetical protein